MSEQPSSATPRDEFSEFVQALRQAFDGLEAFAPNHSRLLSVGQFLSELIPQQTRVTEFAKGEDSAVCSMRYESALMAGTIEFKAWSPTHRTPRGVNHPNTALAMNKMLASMNEYWQEQTKSLQKQTLQAHKNLQDLLMRVFVRCSESSRYSIESDDGFWNCLFCDMKNNVSLEITLQGK